MDLKGIYDGYSYTSPYALFTTQLKDWAIMKTVKDDQQNKGASQMLTFTDKDSNEYQIMASFANPGLDSHAMIMKMVENGRKQGQDAVVATTADGEECLLARSLIRHKNSNQGFGLLTTIFVRGGVIFDLTAKSKPADEPSQASKFADQAFGELWKQTIFRGQVEGYMDFPEDVDPRVPVIAVVAKELAGRMGYEGAATPGKKAIIRVTTPGEEGPMTLSLGIAAKGNEIITTEAVSCKANDMKAMQELQASYYKRLSNALANELLTVTRSKAMDSDLLLLPTKGK